VISGFNTDVEFDGVTYHVQTEDKGLSSRFILSLVYDRGTILASRRVPYDDLVENGPDEAAITERLRKQHGAICAAIKAGRIEDLKKLGQGDASRREKRSAARALAVSPVPKPAVPVFELEMPIPMPRPEEGSSLEDIMAEALPTVDVISIIEEDEKEFLLPENAVAVVSDMAGKERVTGNKLTAELLDDAKLMGGERRSVSLLVCRGSDHKVVAKAQVMFKVIGSSFRPLIIHSETDNNGIARAEIRFPKFRAGRAAFLARVISSGEEVEIRRPVTHG
jgi:hypothetical protein